MDSRTGRHKKWVRESILQFLQFPVLEKFKYGQEFPHGRNKTSTGRYCVRIWFSVLQEIKMDTGRYNKMSIVSRTGKLNTSMSYSTGRSENRVRKDIESEYSFPYLKK